MNARSLLKREKECTKEGGENRGQLSFPLLIASVLIRVSSAKLSGVNECMEAISTLRGRSQMLWIGSWRLIHSCRERSG